MCKGAQGDGDIGGRPCVNEHNMIQAHSVIWRVSIFTLDVCGDEESLNKQDYIFAKLSVSRPRTENVYKDFSTVKSGA